MKIWARYLWNSLASTFSLFLFALFCVYTIVDLSIHGVRFFSKSCASLFEICLYYGSDFITHLPFFLPLTFLLAMLKIFIDLSLHHELVAFQMAGISQRKLRLPFFAFALLLTALSYGVSEFLSPYAQENTRNFRQEYSKRQKKEKLPDLYHVKLSDESDLIYQDFLLSSRELYDVFWVENEREFWHIKFLTLAETPQGRFVDHFTRNKEGILEKTESFQAKAFPTLSIENEGHFENYLPIQLRSLSTLWKQSRVGSLDFKEKGRSFFQDGALSAHLHYKLALPLVHFCIVALIGHIAFHLRRGAPIFLMVALSIFAFVSFMTFLEAMLILGENQVLPGAIAAWSPFLIPLGIYGLLKTKHFRIQ